MNKLSLLSLLLLVLSVMGWASVGDSNRSLSSQEVEKRVTQLVKSELPAGVTIEIENLHTDKAVPESAKLIQLEPQPPLGFVSFSFLSHGKPVSLGSAVVRGFARVAVAKTAINSGDPLSDRVIYQTRDLTPLLQRGYFLPDYPISSLRANGYVRPGSILCAANTKAPNAVEHGQALDLITRRGNLVVSARVRALESGKMGDWVQVQNMETRKTLTARVTGPGEVETR